MNLKPYGWREVFEDTLAAATHANVTRAFFSLPPVNLFPTFRVHVSAFTAGSVSVFLRFGFQDADAAASALGVNFAAVAALDASDYRSQVWVNAAVAPDANGNPLSILPPRVAIRLTCNATTLTYSVFCNCIGTW